MTRKFLVICSLALTAVFFSINCGCGRINRMISPENTRVSLPGDRGYSLLWTEDMSIFDTPRVKAAIRIFKNGDEHELKKAIRRAIQDLKDNPSIWHHRKADASESRKKAQVIAVFAYASADSRQDPMLVEDTVCLLGRAVYVSRTCEIGRIPRFDSGGSIKLDKETFFWKPPARLAAGNGNTDQFSPPADEPSSSGEETYKEPRIGPEEVVRTQETPSASASASPGPTPTAKKTPAPSPAPRLTGVVSGPDKIMAIISIGSKSYTVSPGERFAGGFYVSKITQGEIILEKNGKKMTVKLEE
ncbi:MAG: hypothetical protein V2A78_03385 [bacterium]